MYFPPDGSTGYRVQESFLLGHRSLAINLSTYRKGRGEEEQVPYAARSDCSLFKDNHISNKGGSLEGHKRGYEGLFYFWELFLLKEVGRSCNRCWCRHDWYG